MSLHLKILNSKILSSKRKARGWWRNSSQILINEYTQNLLCSKTVSHDEEVRKLYEEMEQQIRAEKERVLAEVQFSA